MVVVLLNFAKHLGVSVGGSGVPSSHVALVQVGRVDTQGRRPGTRHRIGVGDGVGVEIGVAGDVTQPGARLRHGRLHAVGEDAIDGAPLLGMSVTFVGHSVDVPMETVTPAQADTVTSLRRSRDRSRRNGRSWSRRVGTESACARVLIFASIVLPGG